MRTTFATSIIACIALAAGTPVRAGDVTYERLVNPEPQNWLMNHHDYAAQRYSALSTINKSNVKGLRLAFAVALGGTSGNENLTATPLVDDGFMYVPDAWGVVYKIDVRSGRQGDIVWKMDPGQEKIDRNRGVALWGNLIISVTSHDGRVIATDRDTGKIVWERNLRDQPTMTLNAAPLALKDSILVGASGGDGGSRNWVTSLDAKTGNVLWKTHSVPAPGEPGSETWKDKNNAWQTGGGAFYVTGSYDPATNISYWGAGNPTPKYDSSYRPGDNLFTNSAISYDPDTGAMNWYFQFTPGDMWDYDEVGTHILIDGNVAGEPRKLITHSARNGFLYTMDRFNGQTVLAKPYMEVNWTKGIDQKTGKPLDYDPTKDIQTYAGIGNLVPGEPLKRVCPSQAGGNNYWPSSYSPKTKLLYIPALSNCVTVTIDREKHTAQRGWNGGLSQTEERWESNLTAADPLTGEVKKSVHLRYPNYSGTLATGGGVVFLALLDGTVAAYDDTSLDELWKINVGSGFSAPPMTFEVNGKQYVAIVSGPSPVAKGRLVNTPELKEQRNALVLYVFGL